MKSIVDDPLLVAKRRSQLALAAITLFSRDGFHQSTVKGIAVEAGVSAGLVYQYVSDKQDLLYLALQHIVQRNKEEIPAALEGVDDPIVRLESAINAYARVVAANRTAVLLTYRETKMLKPDYIELMKQHELETNGFIEACLDDCIAAGYLKETHVELLAYRIITAAHVWALKHWRLAKIVSFDEYLEDAIHACWRPLLSTKGTRHIEKLKRDGQLLPAAQAL